MANAKPWSTANCALLTPNLASDATNGAPHLRNLGVGKGDRVATIAPNTHQHLEQFYAIPQLGAVIVPINYRLSAEDFIHVTEHSGATVLCAHADYLDAVDSVRSRMPGVRHFVALEGEKSGWLSYESLLQGSGAPCDFPEVAETDLLSINYTSGTTSRPKGVMITHRNAWMNSVGSLAHWPMTPADRYLWTLPMFHANGWTFVWTVTAAGAAHICLRAVDAAAVYEHVQRERVTHLCAAPTVLISIANGPAEQRDAAASRRARDYRRGPAGRRDHRTDGIRARLGCAACVRADRNGAVHQHLRAAT